MKMRSLLSLLFLTLTMTQSSSATAASKTESATFGGGCFWCMEAVFQRVPGVIHSVSGYSGGKTESPTYEDICGHGTGHAEVIQVEFDPAVISYAKVLEIFFESHDPTTLNRQGRTRATSIVRSSSTTTRNSRRRPPRPSWRRRRITRTRS